MKKIGLLFALGILFFSCKKNDLHIQRSIATDNLVKEEVAYPGIKGITKTGYYLGEKITYREIGNLAVFWSDIVMPKDSIWTSPTGRIGGAVRASNAAYWFANIVPFAIDPNLPNQQRVTDAIAHWQANTNVRFVQRTIEPDYVQFIPDQQGIYSSSIGKAGGRQTIGLTDGATTGNTIHEIGHAVGFYHEQSRADRDGFIEIHWNNIIPGYENNFYSYTQLGKDGIDIEGGLDFGSIMMYGPTSFSSNGQPTITLIGGGLYNVQRDALSNLDLVSSARMYPHMQSGFGEKGEGAGITTADINGNGIPDIILMAYDAPSGPNQFRYQVGFDLNVFGNATSWSNIKYISGVGDIGEGADLALGDVDRNGTLDLILMAYDAPSGPNYFKYKVGFNLNSNGDATSWSGMIQTSGLGNLGEGAGVSLTDLDHNGLLDIVLMAYDAPSGPNFIKYKVGYNLSTSGVASTWTSGTTINGFGDFGNGAGISFADIDNNGTNDIILMAYDNPSGANFFKYRIGLNVNAQGIPQTWLADQVIPGVGDLGEGAGLTIADVDGNGIRDLILMTYDGTPGNNWFKYRIGFNLNNQGIPAQWR